MDCGSKGYGFKSRFLPIFKLLHIYNFFIYNNTILFFNISRNVIKKFFFYENYFLLNKKIWQEGFLIDFLQKKISDNWIKKFLIFSSYLFNERLMFDKIVRFYLDLIIWPFHKISIFEFNNISNLFLMVFLIFVFSVFNVYLYYIYFTIFF